MADRKSRLFQIDKMEIETSTGDKYDFRDIMESMEYYESIDSPFLRCDFTIIDSIDFNKLLIGGEKISVKVVTNSSGEKPIELKLRVFKIGSLVKQERGQIYILHCVSPEAYANEMNKVFKPFGPIGKNVENIPKHICSEYLKLNGQNPIKWTNN